MIFAIFARMFLNLQRKICLDGKLNEVTYIVYNKETAIRGNRICSKNHRKNKLQHDFMEEDFLHFVNMLKGNFKVLSSFTEF